MVSQNRIMEILELENMLNNTMQKFTGLKQFIEFMTFQRLYA